jgi:hypothetical protein
MFVQVWKGNVFNCISCEHHYGLLFERDWNFCSIWHLKKCIYFNTDIYICYARKIFGEQTMSRTWGCLYVDLTSAYDVRTGVSTVSWFSYFTDFIKMFQNSWSNIVRSRECLIKNILLHVLHRDVSMKLVIVIVNIHCEWCFPK